MLKNIYKKLKLQLKSQGSGARWVLLDPLVPSSFMAPPYEADPGVEKKFPSWDHRSDIKKFLQTEDVRMFGYLAKYN